MMLLFIILATTAISFISLVGIFIIYNKTQASTKSLKSIISLAAGTLLGVTFLDLLPESIESGVEPHNIFVTALVSFLIFFILERYFHWHHCRCEDCTPGSKETKQNIFYTNLIGDGMHNLVDGFLIATAFLLDVKIGVITTVAVGLHEIPQEISDFGILLFAGLTKTKALVLNFIFALTAVLGGVLFYFFGQSFSHLIPYMAAFAIGNFLYLAAADLIPELHHEKDAHQVLKHTIWLLVGVLLIYIIGTVSPH